MTVHHTLDIYGAELYLMTTRREWPPLKRKLSFLDDEPHLTSLGSTTFDIDYPRPGQPTPHLIFWLDAPRLAEELDRVQVCAHEASHGANLLLEYLGHDFAGVDEPHAYLVGWLTGWLFEALASS